MKKTMRYLIVGAVAGGASAAARLRRLDENADIVLFERTDHVSYANCGLPYYIGDVIRDRERLFVQTPANFKNRFAIDARVRTEVISIDRERKCVIARNLVTGEEYQERYDKLLLSPGAGPIRPPLPGINEEGIFTLRNVTDTDTIKAYVSRFHRGKAVIIGAGFIGLEMAENLHRLGMQVSIVEMANQVMAPLDYPMASLVQQHIRSKGVDIYLNTTVTGFERQGNLLRVLIRDGSALDADVVILSIGVRPDTRLAAGAGLKIGQAGGIEVNDYLQTSDPDIYAVGDAIQFKCPVAHIPATSFLAGPANKQGRICANNLALGNVQKYQGSIGTAVAKVFDMTVGVAGIAAKRLRSTGIDHIVSTTFSSSHADYYPGASHMTIQLAFSPGTGRLLGAQVVGYAGADKRLDLLASVIKREGTIYDLTEIEHAYAPPFSSAKDPVNIAGFAAENILAGLIRPFYWDEVRSLKEDSVLVDVRTPAEFQAGHIAGALNIPIDELRRRLNELPRSAPIYIYCQIGLRGYLAARILLQNGFDVFNLSGGYRLWSICMNEKELLAVGQQASLEAG